jgi:hypothetical protein
LSIKWANWLSVNLNCSFIVIILILNLLYSFNSFKSITYMFWVLFTNVVDDRTELVALANVKCLESESGGDAQEPIKASTKRVPKKKSISSDDSDDDARAKAQSKGAEAKPPKKIMKSSQAFASRELLARIKNHKEATETVRKADRAVQEREHCASGPSSEIGCNECHDLRSENANLKAENLALRSALSVIEG